MQGSQQEPPASGGENAGVERDIASTGDEGRRAAGVTPPIGDDAEHGQTASPAAEGEVGVPSDEEISAEEEAAREDG